MGRSRRIAYPGAFFHCINRGNHREVIYRDDGDYQCMMDGLEEACTRYGARIHGYCLMPNHFHLLVQQQEHSISTIMRSLTTRYAVQFNRKYQKAGHVFQGRFRGILCDQPRYLFELIRYIHLNPVRAKLVERPQDWKWSSLPAYLGQVRTDWLYRKEVLGLLGVQPQRKLLELLSQAPILSKEIIYPRESLAVMGERSFVLEVTQHGEGRRKQPRVYAGRKLPLQQLAEIFSRAAGMTLDEMYILHKGSRQLSKLRDQIIYVGTHLMFYSVSELSRFLKITPAAVTISNRRFMENIRLNPRQQDGLIQLLTKNS